MNIEQVSEQVQRYYNKIEFTNKIKRIGIAKLRKQQYDKGYNKLSQYIEHLYKEYLYQTK